MRYGRVLATLVVLMMLCIAVLMWASGYTPLTRAVDNFTTALHESGESDSSQAGGCSR